MAREKVYTICGMCSVRCPMVAEVENGEVVYIQGNPQAGGIKGSLCARGAAGIGLLSDDERPQYPMIRAGERGEGKWKRVSWDEAFQYVADKLTAIQEQHGKNSVLFSDRGGPFPDLHKAFMRAIGSVNYCNHDASCARNVQHGAKTTMGMGRKGLTYDLRNAKHVVCQTRNIFESINVAEVNNLMDAMDDGCKLTTIDIRAQVTASKSDNFFLIRPGTDYAFNLAVIHELIYNDLYDKRFVELHFKDFDVLKDFVKDYTPAFAAAECGVDAQAVRDLARQLAEAAPAVIWHPGWMTARYGDSVHLSRTAYIINALLGSIGAKGGLPFPNKPGDFGRKGLKALADLFPKPEGKRVDGCGWMEERKHFDAGPGLVSLAYDAIETGEPYPIKAYVCHRFDPLMAFPDPDHVSKMWNNLDLLVAVTFSWSDTAWYADVVLPMSTYLERESILLGKNGGKPHFQRRARAVQPRFDTKADWEIFGGITKAMGIDGLSFDSAEDLWNYQLQDTGVSIADFDANGMVFLTDKGKSRTVEELSFKTPSGKFEPVSGELEADGLPGLPPYKSPAAPPEGTFRITFGRCGVHTQGHTVNNPLLSEQMPENVLWMHTGAAAKLGLTTGDTAVITGGSHSGKIKTFVTDLIHPEAVFMIHGFGHTLPVESRAIGRGVADNKLMPKGIKNYDRSGGATSNQEHFVTVAKA